MAAHVLRLRAALLVGALRGRQRARMASGTVLIALGAITGCVGLAALQDAAASTVLVVTAIGGGALTASFALGAFFAHADDQLDPRRFAPFDLSSGEVTTSTGVAGVVSVPVVGVLAVTIGTVALWNPRGVPWPVSTVSALLTVVTCIMLARVCFGAAAMLGRRNRPRESTGILLAAVFGFLIPLATFAAAVLGAATAPLVTAARVLGDTPFGAAWALPALFADGDTAGGWISLAVAVVTPVVLGAAWYAITARLLSTTARPLSAPRAKLGWFVVMPATPGGAIAARSLIYWLHDRRYLLSLVVPPPVAVLCMLPLLVAGVPFATAVLLPVPLIALFLGWMAHNDVAYDATAVWIHFAADVRGASDRIGRLVPILVIGIPALAVLIPIAVALHGDWAVLPMMVGVCAVLYLCGLGLSSIASVLAPYPVTLPGDSALRQPERSGVTSVLSPALVLVGALAFAAPVLWWGWNALHGDRTDAQIALWGGVGIGLVVLIVGVAAGSAAFEHRRSTLMEFAETL